MIRHLHDRFTLDSHSYICQPYSVNGSMANIHVGKFCSIAQGAIFDVGFQHYYKAATTFPMHMLKDVPSNVWCRGDITLHNDVWCGNAITLMGGVTIGNGAVIGANTVVRRDILPYEIYIGATTPGKFRFSEPIIEKLLEIAWWDWPEERVLANAALLVNPDIQKFLNEHV